MWVLTYLVAFIDALSWLVFLFNHRGLSFASTSCFSLELLVDCRPSTKQLLRVIYFCYNECGINIGCRGAVSSWSSVEGWKQRLWATTFIWWTTTTVNRHDFLQRKSEEVGFGSCLLGYCALCCIHSHPCCGGLGLWYLIVIYSHWLFIIDSFHYYLLIVVVYIVVVFVSSLWVSFLFQE